jgi:hypothetical protein
MDFQMVPFIEKIEALAVPNFKEDGEYLYCDQELKRITDPAYPEAIQCSTLQGFVDLYKAGIDELKDDDVLAQVVSPAEVRLLNRVADKFGRRKLTLACKLPQIDQFQFGKWQDPGHFIISAQQCFQRVKVQNDDGTYAQDLDYVLSIASSITADQTASSEDDGISQRVGLKRGITLKAEAVLRPRVSLAPYRTFADVDQPLTLFIFRAKVEDGEPALALFEGDGGRWKITAAASIKAFLQTLFGAGVPVTS